MKLRNWKWLDCRIRWNWGRNQRLEKKPIVANICVIKLVQFKKLQHYKMWPLHETQIRFCCNVFILLQYLWEFCMSLVITWSAFLRALHSVTILSLLSSLVHSLSASSAAPLMMSSSLSSSSGLKMENVRFNLRELKCFLYPPSASSDQSSHSVLLE